MSFEKIFRNLLVDDHGGLAAKIWPKIFYQLEKYKLEGDIEAYFNLRDKAEKLNQLGFTYQPQFGSGQPLEISLSPNDFFTVKTESNRLKATETKVTLKNNIPSTYILAPIKTNGNKINSKQLVLCKEYIL